MVLTMKEKQAVTREYKPRYQKAAKKEKRVLLDEFTRLTGYHRKSSGRLLRCKPIKELMIYPDGEAVKLKPEKKRPANRKGKRVYIGGVIASLRLIWAFFWYKCGRTEGPQILTPLMRQQMDYIARWPTFHITGETAEKLKKISPATIDRYLKKDKEALRLKGKSLTEPLLSLKSRIPIRATSGQYLLTLTATDVASGWLRPIHGCSSP
jgi:hypothetical protein